ncbi:hypothetical protein G7046_g3266 [Stylonectria norvegica]|nr:hypothetical protein G7046_g3266 [Stylonectria norvegica]
MVTAIDPGIGPEFRALLVEQHFLTLLTPSLTAEMASLMMVWDFPEHCHIANEIARDMVATYTECNDGLDRQLKLLDATTRADKVVSALCQNKDIAGSNVRRVQDAADMYMPSVEISGLRAFIIGGIGHDCLCGSQFAMWSKTPPTAHLRCIALPCCGKAIHFSCFKRTLRVNAKCPYCRHDFSEDKWYESAGIQRQPGNLPSPHIPWPTREDMVAFTREFEERFDN